MKFKKLLSIAGFCTMMILTSSLEAGSGGSSNTSNGIAISNGKEHDFIIVNGKAFSGDEYQQIR